MLSVYFSVETGIADGSVDPVVEAISQIARARVSVLGAPSGEQHFPPVSVAGAFSVLQEQHVRRLRDDHAAVGEAQAGGNAQFVGKDREFVRNAVPIGGFANGDLIVPFSSRLHVVGIVERFRDPQPAALVEGHANRLLHVWLTGHELQLESRPKHHVLHRDFWRQRVLHRSERIGRRSPGLSRGIERNLGRRIGEVIALGLRLHRPVARRPANAAFQQIYKIRIGPRSLIVPPGGIEHPPVALRARPGVRLLVIALNPIRQNRAVLLIVHFMHVRLIPTLDRIQPLLNRMIRLNDRFLEDARLVTLEPSPNQCRDPRRVQKAIRPAMNRREAVPALDEVKQCLFLLRRDLQPIRIQQEHVIPIEILRIQIAQIISVNQIDSANAQGRGHVPAPLERHVMAVVSQE